ncbi:MAG: AMP-binding protein [Oscillospiraceae bacterium]|nr:AMP-binding protein [Oscillospiraceae bacterium]
MADMANILERFLPRTEFSSYEDFFNNYAVNIPDGFNFGFDVVDAWAELAPDRLALWWIDDFGGEVKYTFSDIKRQSDRTANFFADLGIGKGDFVMLILKQRHEYWICATALHKLGAILIPASAMMTSKDIVYRNNAAGVSAIVAAPDARLLEDIRLSLAQSPTVKHVICVGLTEAEPSHAKLTQPSPTRPAITQPSPARTTSTQPSPTRDYVRVHGFLDFGAEIERRPDGFARPTGGGASRLADPFLIYFTSGTTGMPKMVMHDYTYPLGHITTSKYWQRACDGALHLTALSDSGWAKFGWGKIYGQWICGAAVFAYDMDRFAPLRMLEIMRDYPITTYCAGPTMYRFMIQEDVRSYDLSSITHYTTAGEPLNPEVFNQWKALTGLGIIEGFGLSESSVLLANFEWFEPKPGSMGKPSPLYKIAVVDEEYNVCDEGIEGQIVVRGVDSYAPPGLFRRYYNDEALNRESFRNGCYNTGDVAWMDPDGYYWFVGRSDDIIKSSGYRIGPFEVESALIEHEAVVECAVTAVPDPRRGNIVKATVVLAKGYAPGDALVKELQDHVKRVTAPYKYPRVIEFTDELPKTIGGKIRRGEIRGRNGT